MSLLGGAQAAAAALVGAVTRTHSGDLGLKPLTSFSWLPSIFSTVI